MPLYNGIVIFPDNGYWESPEFAPCEPGLKSIRDDKASSLLHEMTHLFGTHDHAYSAEVLRLKSSAAADNADTYAQYASSVHLGGCEIEQINGTWQLTPGKSG
jgi:deuterolysin